MERAEFGKRDKAVFYPLQIAQNSLSESEKLILFVRLLIAHVSFTQLSLIIILFIQ